MAAPKQPDTEARMAQDPVPAPATAALAKAQSEMEAVIKNAQNPHLKNKYADLGAVIDACLPALNANGFALVQPIVRDEQGLCVETRLEHVSGHHFATRIPLLGAQQDMQRLGSAITYARRYGLLALAGLAPEDDDGNAASRREPHPPAQDNRPLVEQMGPQPSAKDPAPEVPIVTVFNAVLKQLDLADSLGKLEQLEAKPSFRGAMDRLQREDPKGFRDLSSRLEAQREALRPPMPDDGIPGLDDDVPMPPRIAEAMSDVPGAFHG